MNQVKLNELIKNKAISVPLYVLRMFQEFNLTSSELSILFFLYDKDGEVFNPKLISESLNMDLANVLENVSKLVDKDLINVVTKINDSKIKEEVFDLSPLFNKITIKTIEELNEKEEKDFNIYDIIKDEFNRNLTPMECERIDEWKKNNYSDELIREAIKEASLNDVHSIRYIDKILYEWNKKGYQKKEDIKKVNKEKVEVYNCNWLDSDEEI